MRKFEKISFLQFSRDICDDKNLYDEYNLPKRGTLKSAGYDFYLPEDILVPFNGVTVIPTGIRCQMEDGWVLKCYPRSGHGFKYGIHLANSVGIIDEDYFYADNEGHIQIKLVNDSLLAQEFYLERNKAFCQGIFVPFGITIDDNVSAARTGGFGSTDKK